MSGHLGCCVHWTTGGWFRHEVRELAAAAIPLAQPCPERGMARPTLREQLSESMLAEPEGALEGRLGDEMRRIGYVNLKLALALDLLADRKPFEQRMKSAWGTHLREL